MLAAEFTFKNCSGVFEAWALQQGIGHIIYHVTAVAVCHVLLTYPIEETPRNDYLEMKSMNKCFDITRYAVSDPER